MDEAIVAAVLRRAEWAWSAPGGFWPWCYQLKSDGHAGDCKLAALLAEGEAGKEQPSLTTYPIMICSVCRELDGICGCPGGPVAWPILGGGAEELGEDGVLPAIDLTPEDASDALTGVDSSGSRTH